MDPAIQVILEQLKELSTHQDKLVAYQELRKNISTSQKELKKDINATQNQLAACQKKLENEISVIKTG
jgi:predicted  nucleic acid-binding Zn-ribbon protein